MARPAAVSAVGFDRTPLAAAIAPPLVPRPANSDVPPEAYATPAATAALAPTSAVFFVMCPTVAFCAVRRTMSLSPLTPAVKIFFNGMENISRAMKNSRTTMGRAIHGIPSDGLRTLDTAEPMNRIVKTPMICLATFAANCSPYLVANPRRFSSPKTAMVRNAGPKRSRKKKFIFCTRM